MTQPSLEKTIRVKYSLTSLTNNEICEFRVEPLYGTISQANLFCEENRKFRTPSAKEIIALMCTIYEDEKRTPELREYLDYILPRNQVLSDEHTYEHNIEADRYFHFKTNDPRTNEKSHKMYNICDPSKSVDLIKFCLHDEETYELLLCRLAKSSKKLIKMIMPNNISRRHLPASGIVSIMDSNEKVYYSVVSDPDQEGIIPLVLRK